ncbi:hypothetical protein AB0D14_24965 [Streptomyces sp. NPDC048484]|uniref:hypothetical protein n=1 Tax=Streptomyces sp. NPDC048484 TaxID=3155146 RepID=UPI003430F7C7
MSHPKAHVEAADHAEIYVPHGYPEPTADLGEIRLNHAVAGHPDLWGRPGSGREFFSFLQLGPVFRRPTP